MPTRNARIAAFTAVAATAVAQYFIRHDPTSSIATACMLLAALMAAAALTRDGGSNESETGPAATGTGRFRSGLAVAVLGLVVLAAGSLLLFQNWESRFYRGWLMLTAGTALLSAGLRMMDGPAPRTWRRSDTVVLATIVAIGTALRFYHYSEFPGAFTTHAIEEQQTGLGGYRVLMRGYRPWEFWLDYQLTALALWFDPKPTFNTIRVPYTIVSALTPIPVYFLLRGLVRTPAARFGTLLYAGLGWNLVYSRCAHPIFPTNILVIAVLALLVHYGRTRRLAAVPWIGLLSGYTLYSYAGYRGTPLFAAVFLLGCAASDAWKRLPSAPQRRFIRGVSALLLFAGVVIAVGTPVTKLAGQLSRGYYFEAAQRALANREYYTDDTDKFLEQRLVRIRQSAEIFMHLGDGSLTFNMPGKPMLDPATAVLALIGLFIACLRLRRDYNAFLVFMLATLMLVGTVFVQNLDVRRLQGITVLIVAFSALTFDQIWTFIGERRRMVSIALGLAIGGYVTWSSYDLYFRQMAGEPMVRTAFRDQYTTLIHWGYEQPVKRPILVQSLIHRLFDRSYHYRYNYSWLIDEHLEGEDLGDASELLDLKSFRDNIRAVVSQENYERRTVGILLQAAYPGTHCEEFSEPESARTALTVCTLPETLEPPRVRPTLNARYAFTSDSSGNWFLQRQEPFLGFGTYPRSCYTPRPNVSCRGEWDGTFTVPADGDYAVTMLTYGRTTASATVDGVPVPPEGLPLQAGEHTLHAEATMPRDWDAGVRLSLRRGEVEEVIPFWQ